MCRKCIINVNCVKFRVFFLIVSEVFLRNPQKMRAEALDCGVNGKSSSVYK